MYTSSGVVKWTSVSSPTYRRSWGGQLLAVTGALGGQGGSSGHDHLIPLMEAQLRQPHRADKLWEVLVVKTRLEVDSVTVALSWCDRVYVGDICILHDNATNSVFRLLFFIIISVLFFVF